MVKNINSISTQLLQTQKLRSHYPKAIKQIGGPLPEFQDTKNIFQPRRLSMPHFLQLWIQKIIIIKFNKYFISRNFFVKTSNDECVMAISKIHYGQYHILDILMCYGLGLKKKFVGKTTKSIFPQKRDSKCQKVLIVRPKIPKYPKIYQFLGHFAACLRNNSKCVCFGWNITRQKQLFVYFLSNSSDGFTNFL